MTQRGVVKMGWNAMGRGLRSFGAKRPLRRGLSLALIYVMLHTQGILLFQELRAETGGATAPEVTKFEPVDTTDIVNLATGDFNYNIPILNVPGPDGDFPLSLSYHAGVFHGEEASWTGLGWNVNPGAISRSVRGVPDDSWSGESVHYKTGSQTAYTVGVTAFGVTAGVQYDSTKGYGGYVGYSFKAGAVGISGTVGIAPGGKATWSASASITPEGGEGMGLSASVSSHGAGVGVSYSSKDGYRDNDGFEGSTVTHTTSVSTVGLNVNSDGGFSTSVSGANHLNEAEDKQSSGSGAGPSGAFGSSSGPTAKGLIVDTNAVSFGAAGFDLNYSHSRYWVDQEIYSTEAGYYIQQTAGLPNGNTDLSPRVNEAAYQSVPNESDVMDPKTGFHVGWFQGSFDGYSVMAQGTGGSIRPVRLEDRLYRPQRENTDHGGYGVQYEWPWGDITTNPATAALAAPRFVFEGDTILGQDKAKADTSLGWTNTDWNNWVTSQAGSGEWLWVGMVAGQDQTQLGRNVRFPNGGSRVVKEVLGTDPGYQNSFVGFHIWEANGTYFAFDEPVWHGATNNFAENMLDASSGNWSSSQTQVGSVYAYAWYLKEIRFPDYLDSDGIPGPSDGDKGGWVRMTYNLANVTYRWSSSPDATVMDGPLNRIDNGGLKKAGMMYSHQEGTKQLKYLNRIETATHVAYFSTSPRKDSKQVFLPDLMTFTGGPAYSGVQTTGDPNVINFILTPDEGDNQAYGGSSSFEGMLKAAYNLEGSLPAWTLVSSSVLGSGNCMGYARAYQAPGAAPITFSIGGMSFKGQPIKYNESLIPSPDDPKNANGTGCTKDLSRSLTIQVRLQDQWWGSASTASAFAGLRQRWNDLAAGKGFGDLTTMYRLDDIYLIEKSTQRLVKQVHFTYDYSLCPGTPNSGAPGQGKLTLKALQVFGLDGMDAAGGGNALPPYRFAYANNPGWGNKQSYDRWGFFKSDGFTWGHRDPNPQDQSAWSLTRVTLPTGGSVQVQYEPKDYARVQDRIPNNWAAGNGTVANYVVDLGSGRGGTLWPGANPKGGAAPSIRVFGPQGDASAGVKPVVTAQPQTFIPIESAPDPSDLRRQLAAHSPGYRALAESARHSLGVAPLAPGAERPAVAAKPGTQAASGVVERMVTLRMEYWTAGERPHRLAQLPPKRLTAADAREFSDRAATITKNVLVRMKSRPDGGADLVVVDPEFAWPTAQPNAVYLTYPSGTTTPAAKIGGGVRVKRVITTDGHRSYLTSYTYTDLVNGAWTSSGVAATEPPPGCFSTDDDRIIKPEYEGLYANEGGGIVHSRVIVRHAFTEDPVPAGALKSDGQVATTPMGEAVYRFLTSADLPHKVQVLSSSNQHVVPSGNTVVQAAYRADVFNMSGWWGQLLWQESRDAQGKPLGRTEKRFAQLDAYLRLFGSATLGQDVDGELNRIPAGSDADPVKGMGYAFGDANRPVPQVVSTADTDGQKGVTLPAGHPDYLQFLTDVNVFRQAYSKFWSGAVWEQSQINVVREFRPLPIVSETRTYSEGLKLVGVERNKKWDLRTGQVLETEVRGRRTGSPTAAQLAADIFAGHESLVSRTWPAYWVYPTMDVASNGSLVNMLSQPSIASSLRVKGDRSTEVFLNSKVTSWWNPESAQGTRPTHWVKGGEFVWNGKNGGASLVPPTFPGFTDGWAPTSITESVGGYQPYKASGWLFGGAVTAYDDFNHALEAVEGDGVYGCSKYGYPYTASGQSLLSAGSLPVAKFSNARDAEVLYWNFEGPVFGTSGGGDMVLNGSGQPVFTASPVGAAVNTSSDPLVRLATVYTGERACTAAIAVPVPAASAATTFNGLSQHELRYFVKAASSAAAKATYDGANQGEVFQVVPAEGGWWLVRARVTSGQTRTLNGSSTNPIDDVAAFPVRRNGAPASISHFAYDRALGLVTSITGSNGRTMRYKYDALGRLQTVYDAYGNPSASTRYQHQVSTASVVN